MGVLNRTPDSFSDGGAYWELEQARRRMEELAEEGADILDIGGESTRPGAAPVSLEEERRRVLPVVEEAAARFPGALSVDTTKAALAREALEAGAHIINDVSAGRFDPGIVDVIRETGAGTVLMHMQGTPRTMQEDPTYREAVGEIRAFLEKRVQTFVAAGVPSACIAVDPGIGFGKRLEHNLQILLAAGQFGGGTHPVLIGLSRKRFLGEITGQPVEERLAGALAATAMTVWHGANILRTHDVRKTCDAIRVVHMMRTGV